VKLFFGGVKVLGSGGEGVFELVTDWYIVMEFMTKGMWMRGGVIRNEGEGGAGAQIWREARRTHIPKSAMTISLSGSFVRYRIFSGLGR
jgi:hypothetical protein